MLGMISSSRVMMAIMVPVLIMLMLMHRRLVMAAGLMKFSEPARCGIGLGAWRLRMLGCSRGRGLW